MESGPASGITRKPILWNRLSKDARLTIGAVAIVVLGIVGGHRWSEIDDQKTLDATKDVVNKNKDRMLAILPEGSTLLTDTLNMVDGIPGAFSIGYRTSDNHLKSLKCKPDDGPNADTFACALSEDLPRNHRYPIAITPPKKVS